MYVHGTTDQKKNVSTLSIFYFFILIVYYVLYSLDLWSAWLYWISINIRRYYVQNKFADFKCIADMYSIISYHVCTHTFHLFVIYTKEDSYIILLYYLKSFITFFLIKDIPSRFAYILIFWSFNHFNLLNYYFFNFALHIVCMKNTLLWIDFLLL